MATHKANVAVGFIVCGVLMVFFGVVLTFVGPIIIEDQVVKVRKHSWSFPVRAVNMRSVSVSCHQSQSAALTREGLHVTKDTQIIRDNAVHAEEREYPVLISQSTCVGILCYK